MAQSVHRPLYQEVEEGDEMSEGAIRTGLLNAGVNNLKEFGYSTVSVENILTDYVYSKFFLKMLEETIEDAPSVEITQVAEKLVAEIAETGNE